MSLSVFFHNWINIGHTNIKLFLFEMFFYGQYFPKYVCCDQGILEKFRVCIFSLNFIFPLQPFNIITLNPGHMISKINVGRFKLRHAVYESGVYMCTLLW